jgi:PTS system glucose-specific IIA component
MTVLVVVDKGGQPAEKISLSTSGQVSHDQEVATVVAK